MPYSWKIDPEARLAHVRGWGAMIIDEALDAPRQLVEHPDFEPAFSVLVDLRELVMEPVAEHLVAVGRNLAEIRQRMRGRIALVVPAEHATAAEMGTAMAAAGGFGNMRVYTDPADAQPWLDGEAD